MHRDTAVLFATWFLSGALALYFALLWLPAAIVDGIAIPTGHDAFYHARRILDVATGARTFYEFDDKIHAPEGSWITWSWGYDYFMAVLARVGSFVTGLAPMRILVFIPPLFAFFSAGLLLLCARTLNFSTSAVIAVGVAFALSPLTQSLHGAGQIDHHFVEYVVVLTSLFAGLWYFDDPKIPRRAIFLGVVLGIAPMFHTALFLLQLPLLASYFFLWLRGSLVDQRSTLILCAALLVSLITILIPSAAFRNGFFSYKFLSIFQLYVGVLSCAGLLTLHYTTPRWPVFLAGIAISGLACLPLLNNVFDGMRFVSREFVELENMPEAKSFLSVDILSEAPGLVSSTYGLLIWLLPLIVVGCLVAVVRKNHPKLIYFSAFSLFGIALLTQQYRFHHFGSFALILAPLLWLQTRDSFSAQGRYRWAVPIVVMAAFLPCLSKLHHPLAIGGHFDYGNTRGIYGAVQAACARAPGIVLADNNDGHYIRFHSECAVISNNLLMSEISLQKFHHTRQLMGMQFDELIGEKREFDYLLVRRMDDVYTANLNEAEARAKNSVLGQAFLWNVPEPAARYTILAEGKLAAPVAGSDTFVRFIQIHW